MPAERDRPQRIARLAVELSRDVPGFCVWKNAESAIHGTGDLDALTEPRDWQRAYDTFRTWASEESYEHVLVCDHLPGSLLLAAATSGDEHLVEVHLARAVVFRGAEVARADDFRSLAVDDWRGYRTLRRGAEGLLLFLLHGARHGGRPRLDSAKGRRALHLIALDPDGADRCADVLGPIGRRVREASLDALDGEWARHTFLRAELAAALRSLGRPEFLCRRVGFRVRKAHRCRVVCVTSRGRRLPHDLDVWAGAARKEHLRSPVSEHA